MIAKYLGLFCLTLYPIWGATQIACADDLDINAILKKGLAIQSLLAHDKLAETKTASKEFSDRLKTTLEELPADHTATPSLKALKDSAASLVSLTTDKEFRLKFQPFGTALVALIRVAKSTSDYQLYFCTMVKKEWAQPLKEPMANPYMGTKMPDCGIKRKW